MRHRFTLSAWGAISPWPAEKLAGGDHRLAARRPGARGAMGRGLNYDHGTGRGVGSLSRRARGPQRISGRPPRRLRLGRDDRLQRARLLQDRRLRHPHREPAVRHRRRAIPGGERPMLGFETLTLAPVDRRLIEPSSMLNPARSAPGSTPITRGSSKIGPGLDPTVRAWLKKVARRSGEPLPLDGFPRPCRGIHKREHERIGRRGKRRRRPRHEAEEASHKGADPT